MAEKTRTYYIGRVHKLNVTEEQLLDAISRPEVLHERDYVWTFIDPTIAQSAEGVQYVYGKLAKYLPKGEVFQVDEKRHREQDLAIDRLLVASSPFVYIPSHAGIAYQHVWNRIEQKTFVARFCSLVGAKFGNFFAKVEIAPIARYEEFVLRLRRIQRITRVRATVYPPNPLFGRLWANLKQYLDRRNVEQLKLQEVSEDSGVQSNLPRALESILNGGTGELHETVPLDMGDAVVLMAADGYGTATVEGHDGARTIIVRTADINRSFRFASDPEPEALYQVARDIFEEIRIERHQTEDQ